MSVTNTANIKAEVGNGIKVAFDFAFKIFAETDLVVYKETATDVFTLQTLNVDYTVSFDTAAETGTVTYTVAPGSGLDSIIIRDTADTQGSSFQREGPMPEKDIENALDKLTLLVQELQEQSNRALKQNVVPALPNQITVLAPVDGKGLRWKDTGGGVFEIESTSTDPDASATAAAASAAAASASASAAASSASAAAGSASAAATSASAAAASAAAAAAVAATLFGVDTYANLKAAAALNPTQPGVGYASDIMQLAHYSGDVTQGDGGWFL